MHVYFQVLAVSETHERSDRPDKTLPIKGFETWKTLRGGSDKQGGGLCIMYKEHLKAHKWCPTIPSSLKYISNERQWLLIQGSSERLAFLHVYIACQNNQKDDFLKWNEDLFTLINTETLALKQQGFTILALGDFNTRVGQLPGLAGNTPDTNKNFPMFLQFTQSASLVILNTLPIAKGVFSRFMDASNRHGRRSLLDYGLRDADSVHTVSSFVIDADARFDCGSDHALIEVDITFNHKKSLHWNLREAIQYNFTHRSDFTKFQDKLDTLSSSVSKEDFCQMSSELMLSHLCSNLRTAGIETFGLKKKLKRRKQQLPKHILDLIKTKNQFCRRLQEAYLVGDEALVHNYSKNIGVIKGEIKFQISGVKLKRRQRIRSKILRDDPCRRKFWSFIKNQMSAAGNITSCYTKENKVVFEQDEIENAVVDHFSDVFKGQRTPVHGATETASGKNIRTDELIKNILENKDNVKEDKYESIMCEHMTMTELDSILLRMSNGKSSGVDQIPPEFLKNGGVLFKQYLLAFYNKIIDEGRVPAELNIGKCCLIWKVKAPNLLDSQQAVDEHSMSCIRN